ncbi:hypothetical protein Tco_0613830 [Tanacetum coccineum]
MGNTDEPPVVNVDPKDWFKKPERPPTPDLEWNKGRSAENKPTQKWLSDLAKVKKPSRTFDDLMSTPIGFSALHNGVLKDIASMDMLPTGNPNMIYTPPKEFLRTDSQPQRLHICGQVRRNRLMCSYELYKFSDGTLISLRDTLKDMANNLEMGYPSVMPRRRWSSLDKKRSYLMIKDIDHQLLGVDGDE